MQYLIDTHVMIWWVTADHRLSKTAINTIKHSRSTIYWSAASLWEISIKFKLGRLEFESPPEILIPKELAKNRIEPLAIQDHHAFRAGQLPFQHKDPFDRMLVAQAQIESLALISNDSMFAQYEIDIVW